MSYDHLADRLQAHPDIGPVELKGTNDREIHIEVSQENLRRYHLALPDIAAAMGEVRAASDSPGGVAAAVIPGSPLRDLWTPGSDPASVPGLPAVASEAAPSAR